jgi:2-oxoglutarate ferredoxin oxidoreductase subunit alpha
MDRLLKKFQTARQHVPKPQVVANGTSNIGIIAYGTSHWATGESRDQLSQEYKVGTDYLRIRAFPFTKEVHDFVASHERIYIIDQNRDAQMRDLLKLDLDPSQVTKLRSVRHYNGLPIDARSITDEIISQEGK